MENTEIASYLGLGTQTVGLIIQSYVSFKKNNIELFFELLLNEKKDLSAIGQNPKLEKLLYNIIDTVSSEIDNEKIVAWKNLTVKLAISLDEMDFSENYYRILKDLTAFDLAILTTIYSSNYQNEYFQNEVVDQFEQKGVSKDKLSNSLKRLATNSLINEESEGGAILGDGEDFGLQFFYKKNEFGKSFLDIIRRL